MAKGEYLGKNAIVSVGVGFYTGKQKRAVVLEEYDESNDTYVGVTHFQDDEFAQTLKHLGKGAFGPGRIANVAVAVRIPGLRRYPYDVEPNYAFQFVLPGEDASPLREIMQSNADRVEAGGDVVHEVGQDEQGNQVFDEADVNKDGVVDKQERKAWNKANPDNPK